MVNFKDSAFTFQYNLEKYGRVLVNFSPISYHGVWIQVRYIDGKTELSDYTISNGSIVEEKIYRTGGEVHRDPLFYSILEDSRLFEDESFYSLYSVSDFIREGIGWSILESSEDDEEYFEKMEFHYPGISRPNS